jgi:hypothetical protein
VVLPDLYPFLSEELEEYYARAVDRVGGDGLTIFDSVYPYHPDVAEVQAGNVYSRGRMFSSVSAMARKIAGEDESLDLVDHYRKTGNDALDLDSISQAGMGEFADSWTLFAHRAEPDVGAGEFRLRADIGSRQEWPGAGWEIDWSIGRYDIDTSLFSKPIEVSCSPCDLSQTSTSRQKRKGKQAQASDAVIQEEILEHVKSLEWTETKTQIIEKVAEEMRLDGARVDEKRVRTVFTEMSIANELSCEARRRNEGGQAHNRDLWGIGPGKWKMGAIASEGEGGEYD